MAEAIAFTSTKRIAVVTGANKGIGFEICRQLASNGVTVILTSRDENRGIEALHKLKQGSGFGNDEVFFHRVDVMDSNSINSLVDFINTKFGKLDILVNNAGISGAFVNIGAFGAANLSDKPEEAQVNWSEIMKETYELAVECLETNYYGPKRMIEALTPLLELSDSPRIVSVSSSMGKLKGISNEWAKGVLSDPENLTEEKIEEVLNQFLSDFKEGLLKPKGWPIFLSAYTVSKAALNAYTRIAAKKKPNICINCVCPGFVKTDINFNRGILSVEEGAASPVRLALLPHQGPSGLFFIRHEVSQFE